MTTHSDLELDAFGLPTPPAIASLLGREAPEYLRKRLRETLVVPCADISERPSKRLRAALVRLGHDLAFGPVREGGAPTVESERQLTLCTQALELLHAGSLIVDDVQDGSTERRGGPTAHARYGLPSALCAGNWLYFWPLHLVRSGGFSPEVEHRLMSLYCEAVERAHYGQALDLNVRVDSLPRVDVLPATTTSASLKTGSITALACCIGATVAGASPEVVASVRTLGERLGVALQRLDDFGNLVGRREPEKRREDLRHLRLSAVWAFAAIRGDEYYEAFKAAVCLSNQGDDGALDALIETSGLVTGAVQAISRDLDGVIADAMDLTVAESQRQAVFRELTRIKETLTNAYF